MKNDSKTAFIILGTGPEARIAVDIANELDVLVFGYLTTVPEQKTQEINDILVVAELGSKDANTLLEDENLRVMIAEKEIAKRRDLVGAFAERKNELITLTSPSTEISVFAKVGRGNLIGPGTVIQANVLLGSFNLLGNRVSIEPDVEIADYCNLQSGALIGQGALIEEGVTVGMGAIVYPGVRLGKNAVVGAGSVVLQDVPEGTQVFGNPAKAL
jgi:sugar O-acyltransferase (sialic acid O-acetyltransferase NeuD family)